MIVVMPNGRAAPGVTIGTPWNEQFPAFQAFENDLLNDIIPLVKQRYSVKKERTHRALANLSMGGGQSLNFGLGHIDTFAWIAGFSSARNTKAAAELVPNPDRVAKELRFLWISCGDQNDLMQISEDLHFALSEMKVLYAWHVSSGGHTHTDGLEERSLLLQSATFPVIGGLRLAGGRQWWRFLESLAIARW